MNTELTPHLLVRTSLGFFRLASVHEMLESSNYAVVTFFGEMQDTPTYPTAHEDLGVVLLYTLISASNRDAVRKCDIDKHQALVNHAGLMAMGMGLKYSYCTVEFFGRAFSTVRADTVPRRPSSGCGGVE